VLKLLAIAGLLFYMYAIVHILKTWRSRDWMNKTIWFVMLSLVGGACVGILFSR